jgi:hypothetical protein
LKHISFDEKKTMDEIIQDIVIKGNEREERLNAKITTLETEVKLLRKSIEQTIKGLIER